MKRIKKLRIISIATGILLIISTVYLQYTIVHNQFLTATLLLIGLGLISLGIKYEDRKRKINEIREIQKGQQKGFPKTEGNILALTGIIIFLAGLGIDIVIFYLDRSALYSGLPLLAIAAGILLFLIGAKKRQKEIREETRKNIAY